MKKLMKPILTLFMAASLMVMSIAPAMAADTPKTIDYVALGDSVAAGVQYPDFPLGSDYGYTDIIASKLEEAGVLGSFNEDFCNSGMTAKILAEKSDILKYPAPPEINPAYNLVKNAEIVTLDIGANDLLGDFYTCVGNIKDIQNPTQAEVFTVLSTLNGIKENIRTKGPQIEDNIEKILQNILTANPKVKIYIMGYYNPLPFVSATYGLDLDSTVKYLNKYIIKKAIHDVKADNKGASITYIETMDAMSSSDVNLVLYDIHPTDAGYQVIAEEFWSQIKHELH